MKKTLSILNRQKQEIPEIVMSGISDQTLNSSAKFANYNLAMMSEYIKSPKKFEKNKNRMIAAAVVIRDSYDDAERVVDQIDQKHQKKWTIFGTEEQVIEKIKYLMIYLQNLIFLLLITSHFNQICSRRNRI